jgi:hypothetical protein
VSGTLLIQTSILIEKGVCKTLKNIYLFRGAKIKEN